MPLVQEIFDKINWDAKQLIPAISQDYSTSHVLMMAWMNKQALEMTLNTLEATYWSRSRNCLWRKGETSGHIQLVKSIYLDCDGDTLLLQVEQLGGISCHTGNATCFYQRITQNKIVSESKPLTSTTGSTL